MRFLSTLYNVCCVVSCKFVHIPISFQFRLQKFSMKFIFVIHRGFDINVKPGGRFTFDALVD